ncbi:MAG: anti-sigma factor [Pseudomonadota bacterium]
MTEDDETSILAAELALGLLEGEELRTAQMRAASDPVFAAQVLDWQGHLTSLTDDLEPLAPSRAAKRALMDRLFPDRAAESRVPFWRAAWLWQIVSVASLVVLALFVSGQFATDVQQGPLYTAEIASAEGDFRVVAVVDKTRNEVILTRTEGGAPEGRILQVWAHGPGEPAESVGLWPEGDSVRLPLPDRIAAVEGVLTLGVSEEPLGGSLTGSPSGRIFGTVDIPGVTADL